MTNQLPTIGARVTKEFHSIVLQAVKPLGFKNTSALVEVLCVNTLKEMGLI